MDRVDDGNFGSWQRILGLGKSSMRVMPWEGSGRYSPGPGMVKLLEKWFYQELGPLMAICSLNLPVTLL